LVSYPCLSANQQQNLPELIQVKALPKMYEDSTHQLWDCDTDQGSIILKICNDDNVADSTFWQGMALLFKVDLAKQLGDFRPVYNLLNRLSPLAIPNFIAAGSVSLDEKAFIAAMKVAGNMINASDINDDLVVGLANHIAKLHSHTHFKWGRFGQAEFDSKQWAQRLKFTLKSLGERQASIPAQLLSEVIELAGQWPAEQFVPIMLDLRWDQFLQQDGKLAALVDLDAFVFAPPALELIMLEYLLDAQQATLFIAEYQKTHALPDLAKHRAPYRLLLFMMNVLGEKDVDSWMQAPNRF
jgi:aminoglycoside phosphotransferase (APT) family kinase protein